MVRVAHISDVHVSVRPLGWRFRDCFNKRATTWMNLRLSRAKAFRRADVILQALETDRQERGIEHVIFSGDATALGYPSEIARAAALLGVGRGPGLAVPGNHDYLIRFAATSGEFERRFGPWQVGQRIDQHIYPFAQKIGDVWLVAVNSARGTRLFWDATGAVGPEQAHRLRTLLSQLTPGPRILVTHYPLRNANGHIEHSTHRLRDHAQAIASATRAGISLWLHGHIHRGFVLLPTPHIPFPVICAGSCTQTNRWMYNEYEISGDTLTMLRRRFDPISNAFQDAERETIPLLIPPR